MRQRLLDGPAPIAALAVASAVWAALRGTFKDLSVYQHAGDNVLHGLPLSPDPLTGLPFTYPPFAAVLMVPLGPLPHWLAAALWAGASMAAMAVVVGLVLRELGRPAPGWLLAVPSAAAVALEPVWQNLAFGQINVLVMLVVIVDLLRPERRWSGVLLGLVAGVKLTPLVFVVLLALVGRRVAALRATLVFAITVVIGAVATEGPSYWTDRLLEAKRVGPPALAHNQSVYGALTRVLDLEPATWLWLVVAGPIAVAIVLLAAAWWRRGDRLLGISLAALAMLVASPISWSHHWVWAVPVALAVWGRSRWVAAAWVAVFVARPILWPPWARGREYDWNALEHVVGNGYLLAALAVASWAASSWKRSESA